MSHHVVVEPPVLYFGTPVVLITTRNQNGSCNISPMSSAWALGDRVLLGLGHEGQCAINLIREKECVLNFPSPEHWTAVERIARTTGRNPVPLYKVQMGFEFVEDKFALGGFTAEAADLVKPSRIAECKLQFEAKLVAVHGQNSEGSPHVIAEVRVVRVFAHPDIIAADKNHIDADRWRPLLYVFRHYFGSGPDLGASFRAQSGTVPTKAAADGERGS